ncbi:hypothetical protein SacmaDRAFT_1499 [Saccharomonospora marina XMU15]|uniref:Uncharacterized protein n=1 Tax=Saccharomonospora marina XMU15 TaxID=882083 RepID=H5X1I4_9PSEU|nr:hypothetical protein [Saccharomonospora marina]EHR49775.1 hypothetical protein SacmaDRAFT_1499 [Saccharomonospora marina XMU15]
MQTWLPLVLFAVAGFLAGGAYSVWKKSRPLSVALGVTALLAAGAAIAWLY